MRSSSPSPPRRGAGHARWRCLARGHEWQTSIGNRSGPNASGCPTCTMWGASAAQISLPPGPRIGTRERSATKQTRLMPIIPLPTAVRVSFLRKPPRPPCHPTRAASRARTSLTAAPAKSVGLTSVAQRGRWPILNTRLRHRVIRQAGPRRHPRTSNPRHRRPRQKVTTPPPSDQPMPLAQDAPKTNADHDRGSTHPQTVLEPSAGRSRAWMWERLALIVNLVVGKSRKHDRPDLLGKVYS